MDKIRFGKTFSLKWTILTNGEVASLSGRDISLEMKLPNGQHRDITFSVEDSNKVKFTYEGKDHECVGVHSLTLWENKGKANQSCVDNSNAFALVESTELE